MTDRYAVFGNPIAHSKSPEIHQQFALETKQDMLYEKQCVAEDAFHQTAQQFFADGGKGLNITVPFKSEAYEFADRLSKRARQAGAVNTLGLDQDGQVYGDNTDGVGMVSDIRDRLAWTIEAKRILLIGAGGAVRGVLGPLMEASPAAIVIVNRTEAKAQNLAKAFHSAANKLGVELLACGFDGLKQQSFDLVINGSSASLSGDLPPIPPTVFAPQSKCYDMMYAAKPTVFLAWASDHGAECADGLGMLVGQAAEAFALWRGVRPSTTPVIAALKQQLS